MPHRTPESLTITAVAEPDSVFLSACKPRVVYGGRQEAQAPAPRPDASPITLLTPGEEDVTPGEA